MKIVSEDDPTSAKKTVIEVNVGDYTDNAEKCVRHYLLPPPTSSSSSGGSKPSASRDLSHKDESSGHQTPGAGCRVEAVSPTCDADGNFVHLVHVPGESRDRKQFSTIMMPVGFSETVAVGGVDRGHMQRSCASFYHYESGQRCKSELLIGGPVLRPVGYGETVLCYGRRSTTVGEQPARRRHRSSVEYRPKLVAGRFADTCYVLPKRASTVYVSYLDVGSVVGGGGTRTGTGSGVARRKWFASAVDVEPRAVCSTLVGRFGWLDDRNGGPAAAADCDSMEDSVDEDEEYEDGGSSGFSSDPEELSGRLTRHFDASGGEYFDGLESGRQHRVRMTVQP